MPRTECSPEHELELLMTVAEALELELGKVERRGLEANFAAMRSERLLVSRRLDSRTLFVQDLRDGREREHAGYRGPEEGLTKVAMRVFEVLDLPAKEASQWAVLNEHTQTASVRNGENVDIGKPQESAKLLRLSRRVEDLPVWSSNLLLRLTAQGGIAFLQVHWPEMTQTVIKEACRLSYLVEKGWNPPPVEGASPEAVEAGILHSPPIGFLMDVHPAIRVIYEPSNRWLGRKPTRYFDRAGREVPDPRMAASLPDLVPYGREPEPCQQDKS